MAEELPQNDRSANNTEKEVIEAREVFLLMKNEYRISRNTRASWYFSHINTVINYTPRADINDFQDELGILSITAQDEQGMEYVPYGQQLFQLTPHVLVTFIALRYRLVFILDVSPSVATVNLATSELLYDEAFRSLETAMKSLVQPFRAPGSQILLCPELYVTVIAHTPLVNCKANQVLMQGCLLTQKNVDRMLRVIGDALAKFENKVAQALKEVIESDTYQDEEEEEHLTGGLFEDIVEKPDTPSPILYLTTPDMSFVNLFRYGILALQLLPEKSAAGIIVITDGVVGLPEASLFESLMGQLRHSTISCSFIQIGEDFQHNAGLGHVPYLDMLSYMAMSTFGVLFTGLPQLDMTSTEMNIFHQAILTWNLQKPLHQMQLQTQSSHMAPNPIMHKKHGERNLQTPISNLISCRLREGYTIQDVHLTKGDSQLEVNMVLLWRDQITIHYLAVSSWPLSTAKRTTHIEVSVLAHYAFLQDVTCPGKKLFNSPYRTALVKKYWQTLQGTTETDQLLVHLQSFAMSPVYYQVPESVKKGVPLFFLLANSTTPQLNVQLSSKDAALTQFANFWKPVLMLDINIWQKWMHTHRIGLVLMHDVPLGKHLHIPNSSGRFHSVMCRQAQMSLNNLLRDWSTFELLENHSYIKLLFQDPDKPPTSFYLLRVSPKPPCMVLRLAFLGGMSGKERNEIVTQLTERITSLTFPQRGTQKDKQKKASQQQLSQESAPSPRQHKPPLQTSMSDTPCCLYCQKPLEKILIRYDRMPHDFFVLDVPPMIDQSGQLSYPVSANKTAANVFTTLSRYLYHRRWVWTMQQVSSMPISMQAVGCILSNLTKIRLQEGFRFSHANSGIVDMVLEVDMKLPCVCSEAESAECVEELHPCIVQYVIFPPHTATTKESASKDDMEEMETTEADGELQIITECWVEPQCGVIVNSSPERKHFDGLDYRQLAEAMYPTDLGCISTLLTFEHLSLLCKSDLPCSKPLLDLSDLTESFQQASPQDAPSPQQTAIRSVPFAFDLLSLLSKCQQVELLFSTCIQDPHEASHTKRHRRQSTTSGSTAHNISMDVSHPNSKLFSLLLDSLRGIHDREIQLTNDQCGQLIDLITRRDRDVESHPLPIGRVRSRQPSSGETGQSVDESSASTSFSAMSMKSLLKTGQSDNVSQSDSSKHRGAPRTPLASPRAKVKGQDDRASSDKPAEKVSRCAKVRSKMSHDRDLNSATRWSCFVKSVNGSHMIFSFIPSSYEDLCALTDAQRQDCPRHDSLEKDEARTVGPTSSPCASSPGVSRTEGDHVTRDAQEDDVDVALAAICSCPAIPRGHVSVPLPLYTYNCPGNVLSDQLVNHWTYTRPPDIYEDLTFKIDELHSSLLESCPSHKRGHGAQEGCEPTSPGGGGERRRWSEGDRRARLWTEREREEGGGEDVYGDQLDLRTHCRQLSDTFLRCFVTAVFTSLQHGCDIDCHDIEAAINNICEESTPLEIDVTRFVYSVCGHVRQRIERLNRARIAHEDNEDIRKTIPKSVSKDDDTNTVTDEASHTEDLGSVGSQTTELTSATVLQFPLALLQGTESDCQAVVGLHALIRDKFDAIMAKSFKPVPSNPDFFFYCLPTSCEKQRSSESEKVASDELETDQKPPTSDENEVFIGDYMDEGEDELSEHFSNLSNHDSGTLDDVDDFAEANDDGNNDVPPLFLYLTCSVRSKRRSLKSIPVRNLPICLGELKECLSDLTSEVNLSDLQITLDIICLMLPPETDVTETSGRPCYYRMTSHMSQVSYTSTSPPASDVLGETDDLASLPTTTDAGYTRENLTDPLSCLHSRHQQAVMSCKDQILWLLQDEIASASRLILPVAAETLEMVADHVKRSELRPMCLYERVPLHFVYGPDNSLTQFKEDFERMHLPGYYLNKEGAYYYLYLNRMHAHMQLAISSKLEEHLEVKSTAHVCSEAASGTVPEASNTAPQKLVSEAGCMVEPAAEDTATVQSGGGDEVLAAGAGAEELLTDIDTCDSVLGGSVVFEDLVKDSAEDHSVGQTTVVVKEDLVETGEKLEAVEAGGIDTQLSEASTGLGAGQTVSVSEVTGGKDIATDEQKATLQGKDIKISIIRPSPVRQVPKKGVDNPTPSSDASSTQATNHKDVVVDAASVKADKPIDEDESIKNIAKTVVLPPVVLRRRHRSGEPVSQTPPVRELNLLERRATLDGSSMVWVSRSLQQLQVSTPCSSSETIDKAGMKRMHSAATLEKYRHEKSRKSTGAGLDTSDPHIAARSRNQSGLQTPKSTSLVDTTSSRSSVGEEGYEGDSSDMDEEGVMMSFSDSLVPHRVLPNFWLIMRIYSDVVDVFFHARDNREEDRPEYLQQKMLLSDIIKNIRAICRTVNQRRLLQELNDTRMCNLLLVPEADEDIRWTQDKFYDFPRHKKGASESDESDDNSPPKKYLADMMKFKPGHFACECVWRKSFILHSRLKMGPGRSGISRGIQALRSILNKFSVNNRKNMFVFRESNQEAVFYLRLNESTSDAMGGTPSVGDGQESVHSCGTFSRSSSIMSLPVKKQTELDDEPSVMGTYVTRSRRLSSADHDGELSGLMSPSSRSATYAHRRDDVILLSAYGICPVSAEISGDLVDVLQKKLNDAVLDVITVTLSRNPMCKLSPDDILFIQPPGRPAHSLRLLIPASAMLQQFALGFYLRQNLLQFTHTPKYTEHRAENVFKDYSDEEHPTPLPDRDVFIYNTPQQSRGKGIACLHLQFVDGRGRPVQLLGSRKPLPLAYKDPLERTMFDSMVSTSVYEPQPDSKSPGPPAVVQMSMWQQGDVVLSQLTDRLILAMKHAVCDIIMEYRLLTAPLCEVPEHYVKGVDSPLHSAPPSPVLTHSAEPCGVVSAQIMKKQSDLSGGKTPKEKTSFSFQSLMSRMTISSLGKENTKVEMSMSGGATCSSHTWHEGEQQRQKEEDIRQKIFEYEIGSRGSLQPLFCGCLQQWLQYCTSLEAPSVSRSEYSLHSRFPIDYVLKELQTVVTGICHDTVPKVFRQLDSCVSVDSDLTFLPYTPSRMPMCSQDYKSESSLDLSQYNCLGVPGRTTRFIVVGRNVQQWQMSIDYPYHGVTFTPDLTHPKTNKNYQRFKPFEPLADATSSPDKSESTTAPCRAIPAHAPACVPRQRFLLIEVQDKEFLMYTYNWSQELSLELDRELTRQLQWQNARSHLLTCIVSQKMGLFQHNLYLDPQPDPNTQGMNPFTNSTTIHDLVKYTSIPTVTSKQLRYGRGRIGSSARPQVALLQPGIMPTPDDVFRDTRPPVAMHCKTDYRKMRDPVHRHGAQLLECRSVKCKESERRTRLEKLYCIWQQRMGPSQMPIAENDLKLLKDSSRLIHNVATPLLFNAQWRRKLLNIPEVKKRHDSQNSTDKPRSRNSSGTSIKSRRSETADLRKKSVGFESPDALSKQMHSTYEEAWLDSMKQSFLTQYIQYLQSLSFVQVQTRPHSPKKLTRGNSMDQPFERPQKLINPSYMYLQKTLPGGIMLIELGFRDVYFCVNVYAFECSRLPVGKTVNRQLAVIFTDECDKFKDLTHAHSFAHDFHLRTIQQYLGKHQPPRFMHGYNLTGFLHDFSQHFSYAPSFAQNLIYEGTVTIDETNSSGHQLFEYMLQPEHAELYNMRRLHMQGGVNDDLEMDEDALCTQLPCSGLDDLEGMSIKSDVYDIGLVISHDTSTTDQQRGAGSLDQMSLRLRYWVIMTHRREIFPRLKLERKTRMAQPDNITSYPATGHLMSTSLGSEADFGMWLDGANDAGNSSEVSETIEGIATSKTASIRQASINYLGYSNVHQVPMYALLRQEADRARDMLKVMVESSMAQCRRDFLWNRMLIGIHEEGEGRRKHRSEPSEEARVPLLTKLTFVEFEELLSFVTKVSLSDIDPTLTPLQNMSVAWYQSLLVLLRKEYTETHRYYVSANNLQYMVVLNPNVNSFMMLAIDTKSMKTELCAVYRDPTLRAVSDSPSKQNHQAHDLHKHFEDFVNVCCYHLWSGILV